MKSYLVVIATLACVGCAHTPSPELQQARRAQQRLSISDVPMLDPDNTFLAKRSLRVAEAAFAEHGDTSRTRALAYVALRRAQRTMVLHGIRVTEARLAALEQPVAPQREVADTQSEPRALAASGPVVALSPRLSAK